MPRGLSACRRRSPGSLPTLALASLLFLAAVPAATAQWRRAGLEGRIVTALAVDPSNPSIVYAGTELAGIWKSTNGGSSWSPATTGYTGDIVSSLAIDPSNPAILYAGSNAGVFKTTSAALSWLPRNQGLPNLQVRALELDPRNPATLFLSVNGAGGGVYRSGDGAGFWSARPLPVPSGTAAAFAFRNFDVYAGWGNVLFRSGDGGINWSIPFPDILPSSVETIAAPLGNSDVVVGLFQRGVYRSVTSPAPNWVAGTAGLTSQRMSAILVRPGEPTTLFAAGNGGGVFRSGNGGLAWTPILSGLGNTDVAALAIDSSGNRLYAGTSDGVYLLDTTAASCGGAPGLCLNGARFRVEVAWRVASEGRSGIGTPVPISNDTGSFWFFDPANLELMIKVLDARVINGRFWVFFGALSDVEYTVTVTDTVTGAVKVYANPQGRLASVADTNAF